MKKEVSLVISAIAHASDVFIVTRGYDYDRTHILIYCRSDSGLFLTFETSTMKLIRMKELDSEGVSKIFYSGQCKTSSLSAYDLDWNLITALVEGRPRNFGGVSMG